ncbi:MAG TPA: energy transducer TonB [Syntrophobacter fumaroxidans]|nr:energy transducer TonB [Syntrophobacter fumaroxidans]
MRLWQNLTVSILGHLGIACVLWATPLAIYRPPPPMEVRLISPADFYGRAEIPRDGNGTGEAGPATDDSIHAAPKDVCAVEQPPPPEERPAEPKLRPPVRKPGRKKESPPAKPMDSSRVDPLAAVRGGGQMPAEPEESSAGEGAAAAGSHASIGSGTRDSGTSAGGSAADAREGSGRAGGPGGGVVDARFGAANGPRFHRLVKPRYPSVARQLGKEGTVVLRVTIDEKGRAIHVEVLTRAGSGFEEEAILAVRESTFIPARLNGHAVKSRAVLPIRFALTNSG